jgi:membrane-anchored glycerophosphoryl diester phosphodiesterase (GDPDase)
MKVLKVSGLFLVVLFTISENSALLCEKIKKEEMEISPRFKIQYPMKNHIIDILYLRKAA